MEIKLIFINCKLNNKFKPNLEIPIELIDEYLNYFFQLINILIKVLAENIIFLLYLLSAGYNNMLLFYTEFVVYGY